MMRLQVEKEAMMRRVGFEGYSHGVPVPVAAGNFIFGVGKIPGLQGWRLRWKLHGRRQPDNYLFFGP